MKNWNKRIKKYKINFKIQLRIYNKRNKIILRH